MLSKPQTQSAGEGTAAIQAGGSADNATIHQTNNYGLTVEQVRAVAQDAFRADFVQLLGQAGDIAEARANRIVERFLDRLQAENPAGLNQANLPDFRYALFTAQKAQARSGDENLEELLVELLIERSQEAERNLQQIVLNESLEVVSRLTDEQIAALSLSFLMRMVSNSHIVAVGEFFEMMDVLAQPYVSKAKLSKSSFSHLAFTGCGVVDLTAAPLSECFRFFYPGLWQEGFEESDPIYQKLNVQARQLVRPSPHTPNKFEVFAGSVGAGEKYQQSMIFDPHQRELLTQLSQQNPLSHEKMKSFCISVRPYMAELFDLWDDTPMKNFTPSSAGIAIAHANVSRSIPNFPPLSVWIN